MECKTCGGSGKITIKASELTPQGFVELPPVEIDCVWCHGKGERSAVEEKAAKAYEAIWCRCGNPSGDTYYYSGRNGHGWKCRDCGKVVQVG